MSSTHPTTSNGSWPGQPPIPVRYCEKVSGDLVDHYQRERELWARGADSVRAELVLGLVSGRPMDLRATSAALGYNLDRSHVAMMVWIDPRSQDRPPLQALKRAAAAIAHQLKGIELLVVPAGAGMVWAWISGPAVTDRPQDTVCVDAPLLESVGGLARGLDGFVASHHQARDARRMSGVPGPPRGHGRLPPRCSLDALLTRTSRPRADSSRTSSASSAPTPNANRRLRTP